MKLEVRISSQFTSSDDAFLSRLSSLYEEIKNKGRVDIFEKPIFKLVDKIGSKDQTIGKIKRNEIKIKRSASVLPDEALKYLIVHELAHAQIHGIVKGHGWKFWHTVRSIYPDYKKGLDLFNKHKKALLCS